MRLNNNNKVAYSTEMEPNIVQNEYFSSYEDLEIHRLMLEDNPRTLAYKNAILNNQSYFKDKIVMDVGCGTGILSIFCAQAGSKKVYAVEASNVANLAKEIIKENKFEDIIEVIQSKVEDLVLPDNIKVDAIVSEWMGFFLLHEGMLDSVLIARDKFLKVNGEMFPESATIYVSPCSVPSLYKNWEDCHGVSMTSLAKQLRASKYNKPEIMCVSHEDILGYDEVALCCINLKDDMVDEVDTFRVEHVVGAKKDGKYQGLCVWFDCIFPNLTLTNETVRLDTGPQSPPTHWKQTIIVLPEEQSVEVGDPIAFQLDMTRDGYNRRRYNLEVSLLDPDEVEHPLPCTCDYTKCVLIKAYTQQHPERNPLAEYMNCTPSSVCLQEDPIEDD